MDEKYKKTVNDFDGKPLETIDDAITNLTDMMHSKKITYAESKKIEDQLYFTEWLNEAEIRAHGKAITPQLIRSLHSLGIKPEFIDFKAKLNKYAEKQLELRQEDFVKKMSEFNEVIKTFKEFGYDLTLNLSP